MQMSKICRNFLIGLLAMFMAAAVGISCVAFGVRADDGSVETYGSPYVFTKIDPP